MTNNNSVSTGAPADNDAHPVIKCDSVYKIFGVNNASFEVHKGEMLVVMGLSGSGKSTLLRCISKLTETTAGNINIDGEDLLAMKPKELIMDMVNLVDLTGRENYFPRQLSGGQQLRVGIARSLAVEPLNTALAAGA